MKCHWLLCSLAVALVMVMVKSAHDCNHETCAKCIQEATCMWCEKEWNATSNMKRCMSSEHTSSVDWREKCGYQNVIEPENYFEKVEDNDFSGGTEGKFIIQLKPQKVKMDLRVQQPLNFTIHYKHAKNYPTDVYYLMDGSKSMKDDQETLSGLAQDLADSIKNITTNFRLGFGMFVDKPILPYVTTVPFNDSAQDQCGSPPYAFRNELPLTDNSTFFEQKVREAQTACNIDSPEGGLDALMQVMVCEKQIDWRDQSLRLIVLATDAGFHYAGDGKLGGIVTPNDMNCHLTNDGVYTNSNLIDYPSISQIHNIAKRSSSNVIFAITENQRPIYDRLTRHIEGASFGVLNKDSSNIVDLIVERVSDITNTVKLLGNATKPLKIRYFSKCKDDIMKERSTCSKLEPGDMVEFVVEVTLEKCNPEENPRNQVFNIYPEGRKESVQVNVSMICLCKCEEPGDKGYIVNAKQCNENGDYKCGLCACDTGYLGQHCECQNNDSFNVTSDDSCKVPDSAEVCSGRGNCICGICQCHTREPPQTIYGKFCECTNYLNCKSSSDVICSGNGDCECNECKCNDGWTGSYCDCQDSTENCINPLTNEVCSEHGTCECNKCSCMSPYYGKHCEDCPDCSGKCLEYKSCVQCQAFGKGELSLEQCTSNCTLFNVTKVSLAEANTDVGERLCSFFDDDDCRFVFVYYNNKILKKVEIRVQETLECPKPVNVIGVILGVLGIVVLIGLVALIAWRILASIQDRREYAKFVLAQKDAKWSENDNPLYKQATTTVQNPMFGENN